MRRILSLFALTLISGGFFTMLSGSPAKEFLTEQEIDKIREAQEIDARVKVYVEAAALRLKTAEERLMGKESAANDPLEFFTPEDMLDGYYRILKSVMMNLDDSFQKPGKDQEKVRKALDNLKVATEKAGTELEILKRIAEEKKKEELWDLVNKAIDITKGAREGADYGLSKLPSPPEKKTKKK